MDRRFPSIARPCASKIDRQSDHVARVVMTAAGTIAGRSMLVTLCRFVPGVDSKEALCHSQPLPFACDAPADVLAIGKRVFLVSRDRWRGVGFLMCALE